MSAPTFANIEITKSRTVRSECCQARISVCYVTTNTTVGKQIVYQCMGCLKLYVVREVDQLVDA
jgi:hypothetical protein